MKKLTYFLLSLLCVGFIASCSDDDEVAPTPEPPVPPVEEGIITVDGSKDLVFDAAASEQIVKFTANQAWTASASEAWLTVEPKEGEAGKMQITLRASDNTGVEGREAMVVLATKDNKAKETIVVNQVQKDALVVAKPAYEVAHEGGAIVVKVGHNVDFDVNISENWISAEKSRAYTEEELTFVVAANEGAAREGVISFISKDGALKQEVKVKQEAKPEDAQIVVAEKQYMLAPEGGEITVKINHNVEFDVVIDGAWLSQKETRAMQESTLTFVGAANDTFDVREGKITFVAKKDATMKQEIVVRQAAGDGLVVGQTEYALSAEAQDLEISVMHNVEFDYAIEGEWITAKETRAMNESKIVFSIAANDGQEFETREGKITFTSKDGKLSQVVKIAQMAPNAMVIAQPEYQLDYTGGEVWIQVYHNVEFTYAVDGSWIEEIQTRALQESYVAFRIQPNEVEQPREGSITFTSKDGDLTQIVVIKQVAAPKKEIQPEPDGTVLEIDDNKFAQWIFEQGDYSYTFLGQRPSITFFYEEGCNMDFLAVMEAVAPEYIGKVDFFKMDVTGNKNIDSRRYCGLGQLPNLFFADSGMWPYLEMQDTVVPADADTLRNWLKNAFGASSDGGQTSNEVINVEFETIPQFKAEGNRRYIFTTIENYVEGHFLKAYLVGDDNNEHFAAPFFDWNIVGSNGFLVLEAKPNNTPEEINHVSVRITIETAEFGGEVVVEKVMPLSIAAGAPAVEPLQTEYSAAYNAETQKIDITMKCASQDAGMVYVGPMATADYQAALEAGDIPSMEFYMINMAVPYGMAIPLDEAQVAQMNAEGVVFSMGADMGMSPNTDYTFGIAVFNADATAYKVYETSAFFEGAPVAKDPVVEFNGAFDEVEGMLKFTVQCTSADATAAAYLCETYANMAEVLPIFGNDDTLLMDQGLMQTKIEDLAALNGAGFTYMPASAYADQEIYTIVDVRNATGRFVKSLRMAPPKKASLVVNPETFEVFPAEGGTYEIKVKIENAAEGDNIAYEFVGENYLFEISGANWVTPNVDGTLTLNVLPNSLNEVLDNGQLRIYAQTAKNELIGEKLLSLVVDAAPASAAKLTVNPQAVPEFPAEGGKFDLELGIENGNGAQKIAFEMIGNTANFADPVATWDVPEMFGKLTLEALPNTTTEAITGGLIRIYLYEGDLYNNCKVLDEKVMPLTIAAGSSKPAAQLIEVTPAGFTEFPAEGGSQALSVKVTATGMILFKYKLVGDDTNTYFDAPSVNWTNYMKEGTLTVNAKANTTNAPITGVNVEMWIEDMFVDGKVIGEKVVLPLSIAAAGGSVDPEPAPAGGYVLAEPNYQLQPNDKVIFVAPDKSAMTGAWISGGLEIISKTVGDSIAESEVTYALTCVDAGSGAVVLQGMYDGAMKNMSGYNGGANPTDNMKYTWAVQDDSTLYCAAGETVMATNYEGKTIQGVAKKNLVSWVRTAYLVYVLKAK